MSDGRPVVTAWGVNATRARVDQVRALIPALQFRVLGISNAGHPRHPLYVRADAPLVSWN
ncbi:DUF1643 domain-containing protein [Leifsonia sp. Leaf264]|uniref:DUF1643 domain-containing protein n=1 Tax=Leifsonia sp. Leaf264 TaxID=1736314 RepID=UPI003FA535B8